MNPPPSRRPRPRRWQASCILRMLREQGTAPAGDDLEARAAELTRELNRLEDRTRHLLWRVRNHEIPSGLSVVEWDDAVERPLDRAG